MKISRIRLLGIYRRNAMVEIEMELQVDIPNGVVIYLWYGWGLFLLGDVP